MGSFTARHGLQLCCKGLGVVAHGFSCPLARGILVTQTSVPCIARRIPNHWTTREVPGHSFFNNKTQSRSCPSWPKTVTYMKILRAVLWHQSLPQDTLSLGHTHSGHPGHTGLQSSRTSDKSGIEEHSPGRTQGLLVPVFPPTFLPWQLCTHSS